MMYTGKKLSLISLILVAGLIAVACSGKGGGGGGLGGNVTKGRDIFATSCVSCHGGDAKGVAGLGKNLVTPSDWMKQQSDQMLLDFLKVGRPASDPLNDAKVDMPPKGGNPALTETDLIDIIAFLRSIQK